LPPSARLLLRLARTIERRGAGTGSARLSAALTRLGPSYVKVGQFLATRPDIVAVKVVRPGVREQFARDLQAMRFAARHFERFVPDARRLRPPEVVETLARSVSI